MILIWYKYLIYFKFNINNNFYQCHKLGNQKCLTKITFLILQDISFQKQIYDFRKDISSFSSINL